MNQLSDFQRRVLDQIRNAGPHGIKMPALVDRVYADDANGGPDKPELAIQAAIRGMNRRLCGFKILSTSNNRRRSYGTYRLVANNEGEHDADGIDDRRRRWDVPRSQRRRPAPGQPATRQAK